MTSVYIIGLSSCIFLILNILYTNYISKKKLEIRTLLYNTILMSISIFSSFEIVNKLLPSIGIDIISNFKNGGRPAIHVFTNDPSF